MAVRRRRPEDYVAIPEKYARFVRSEWPAELDCDDAVEAWHAERSAWAEENQIEFRGYATSPLGDKLDLLRVRREARLLNCIERDYDEDDDW